MKTKTKLSLQTICTLSDPRIPRNAIGYVDTLNSMPTEDIWQNSLNMLERYVPEIKELYFNKGGDGQAIKID